MFTSWFLLLVQFGAIFAAPVTRRQSAQNAGSIATLNGNAYSFTEIKASIPITCGLYEKFVPPINKCNLSDSSCLKASAQPVIPALIAGIPELGTEVLDPMNLDVINIDLSGLKLNIREIVIKGMRNVVIEKISVDTSKQILKLVFHSDFSLKGKYKASGKLLILPISGDGDTVMKIKNTQMIIDMPYKITKNPEGKDVISLKSHKYRFDVKDGATFLLTNLFNGNKPLSDTLHAFMNGNWKTMILEFGLPVFDQPVQKIFNSIKTLLGSVPVDEIALI